MEIIWDMSLGLTWLDVPFLDSFCQMKQVLLTEQLLRHAS